LSQAIAEIAVIARNRRNREGRNSPLINTDDTDQEKIAERVSEKPKTFETQRNRGSRGRQLGREAEIEMAFEPTKILLK
jgi:hypothetical protein